MIKAFRAIIMGAPGSGKGTISSRIVRDFGLQHVSSGDLLRAQILAKTAVSIEAKKYIDSGKLVPDKTMVELICAELTKIHDRNWLLDGFPRTIAQAEELFKREPINVAINLNVPFEVIINRIKGRWIHMPSGRVYNDEFNPPKSPGIDDVTGEKLVQRDDDKPEAVQQRLNVYSKTVAPIQDFYRQKGLLEEFSGTESNVIWPHVHKFLAKHIPPKSGP